MTSRVVNTVWVGVPLIAPALVAAPAALAEDFPIEAVPVPSQPPGPGTTDRRHFTAIDFRTGKTVWRRLAGTGILYDSDCAGTHLGPRGTSCVGVNGGVVAMRDGP